MDRIRALAHRLAWELFSDESVVVLAFSLAAFSFGLFGQTDFVEIAYLVLLLAFAVLFIKFHTGVFFTIEIAESDSDDQ